MADATITATPYDGDLLTLQLLSPDVTHVLADFGTPTTQTLSDDDGWLSDADDGIATFGGDPIDYIGSGTATPGVDVGGFIVPLGTLLTEKLTIQVDSAQAKRYDLSFCVQIGCYARVGFTEAEVNAFRRGQVARVTITPFQAPDQRVTVNMSLAGFTAAYDQITALEQ